MGVPSFYRWLVNKYPKIVSNAVEDENAMEFDNFYLDMNGIIHPCFHPENNLFPPTKFEEVFNSMYEYIDRLFNIVKPRKLLFMAIDGVAPRAKMNQQRARRFRAAKDAQMADEMEQKLRKQFEEEGKVVLPKEESEIVDSNVITPGTEFMHMLSDKLQSYISRRMSENSDWGNIKVILSDDKVPGEGEHKIMEFIRAQRALPGYDPNTRHCLYGLDADLIMLALATHEIHFSILREEVLPPNNQLMVNGMQTAETHSLKSRGWFKEHPLQESSCNSVVESEKSALCEKPQYHASKKQAYQFLYVCILREYLALDLQIPSSDKYKYDLERIIDDFIFICFFSGNDFLPHMPSLEIHEGCIDLLMHVYKKEFDNLGGYLVDMQKVEDSKGAYIKLKRVERFILTVGAYEDQIFSKRSQLRERKLKRILSEHREAKDYGKNQLDEGTSSEIVGMYGFGDVAKLKISTSAVDADTVLNNTKELKQKLKEYTRNQSDLFQDGLGPDKVKLGSPGWKVRFYEEKFSAQSSEEIETRRKSVVAKYGEGLCWVLLYYFSGVPSWTWFYPYHYGPSASDMKGLSQMKVKFQKGVPFKPFDQLMGVLPPRSAHALPMAFKGLMIDANSSIIDFYPTNFETDVDGKRFLWQGICKLPFIDEGRLLTETTKLENGLKDHEKTRNLQTLDRLFVRCSSKISQQILCCGARGASEKIKGAITMESKMEGIRGTLHLMPEDVIEADDDEKDEHSRNDLCMFYETPQGSQHVPRLLEGVNIPEKVVYEEDITETTLWHEYHGSNSVNSNMFQNRRPMKPNSESRAQNPPPFISKGAGCGFSLGRGRPSSIDHLQNPNHFPQHTANFGEYTPAVASSSSYQDYRTRGHQPSSETRPTYNGRSEAGSFRRDGYRGGDGRRILGLGRGIPSSIDHLQNSNHFPQHTATFVEHRAAPVVASSSRYGDYRPRGHQPLSVTRPAYGGRSEAGSFRRDGQGHRNSQSNSFYMSNYRPQQASSNFWQPPSGVTYSSSEDWRLNGPSRAAPGDSRQRNYAASSGQTTQHPNGPFSANTGRGRGRGRGRGWYATQS